MGRLRNVGLWSLAVVTLVAWIPYTNGSTPKTAIKIVKPDHKSPSQEKLSSASKRQQLMMPLSGEDDENYSGPSYPASSPYPPGFIQGAPPRYTFSEPDGPTDRYDQEEGASSLGERERSPGVGFMQDFGPPKGFPDLSKLTGGEFGKMEAPVSHPGGYESGPQYGGGYSGKLRPFGQFSPQGSPSYYDDGEDGPEGSFGGGPTQSISQSQSAPKRRPFRSGRPRFGGGRPEFGSGPSGPSGPGPYGAPDGLGGPGPYGGSDGIHGGGGPYGSSGLGGSGRPFGRPGRPGGPFGSSSDGPSSRPGPGPFGNDGPSSRPFGSDGPSRPGPFGSDGPGPSSRPGAFGESSDGPSNGGLFGPDGSSSDGPGRPLLFGNSDDGPSSSRPGPFDGPSSNSPYDSTNGPSRPGASFLSLDGPPSPRPYGSSRRPSSPFGGPPSRPGVFGAPHGAGNDGPRESGRHSDSPSAFSFQNSGPGNSGPGFRLSRGYPRYHPNSVHNDDFKESADNGDFTPGPYNNPGPAPYNYPPRHQANFGPGGSEDYEQGPPPYPQYDNGHSPSGRSRRPEFAPSNYHHRQQPLGASSYPVPTHRFDSPKRPYVIKVSGLKSSKNTRELPPGPPVFYAPSPDMKTKDGSRKFQKSNKENEPNKDASTSKAKLLKSRPKRDLVKRQAVNGTAAAKTASVPCKPHKEGGCRTAHHQHHHHTQRKPLHSRNIASSTSSAKKTQKRSHNTPSTSKKVSMQDPMLADGTQQTAFWEVAPRFGSAYDAFKKHAAAHAQQHAQNRQDEYEDEDDEGLTAALPARGTRKNQTYMDTTSDEQRFFPSFPAPPSPYLNPFASTGGGFARPPLFPGPTANRAPSRFHPQFGHKYNHPQTNRGPGNAYPAESHDRYLHTNLLGSGNFEVVRGGTYYGDDDDGYHHTGGTGPAHYHQEDDDSYFHHNGHSAPYRNNPSAGGGDFFANFRDFADINPPSRSFSHHHETVADADPHGSSSHEHTLDQPKNILDKLESSSDHIEVHQPYTASSSSSSSRTRSATDQEIDPMMATF